MWTTYFCAAELNMIIGHLERVSGLSLDCRRCSTLAGGTASRLRRRRTGRGSRLTALHPRPEHGSRFGRGYARSTSRPMSASGAVVHRKLLKKRWRSQWSRRFANEFLRGSNFPPTVKECQVLYWSHTRISSRTSQPVVAIFLREV